MKQNQSYKSNSCYSETLFHVIIRSAHALSLPPSFRFLGVEVWMENTQRLTKWFGKRCLLAELIIRYCFVQCWATEDPVLEDFLWELGSLSTSRTLCGWPYLHYCVVLNDATHESAIVTRVKSPWCCLNAIAAVFEHGSDSLFRVYQKILLLVSFITSLSTAKAF